MTVSMAVVIKAFEDDIVNQHKKEGIRIKLNKHFPTPPESKQHCSICKNLGICDCVKCGDNTMFAYCYRSKQQNYTGVKQ